MYEGLGQQQVPVESPYGLLEATFYDNPFRMLQWDGLTDSTFPIGYLLCLQLGRHPCA